MNCLKMILFKGLFLLLLFSFQIISGQQSPPPTKGELKGRVVDSEKSIPLEFATISVYSMDSVIVGGGITATDGSFSIELNRGRYYALVRFISFESVYVDNIEISGINKTYDAGTIALGTHTKELTEVNVTAAKSEMIINLDKKVFNVGQDLSNTGKSALDILDNIPSIAVDLDGNVSLRGSDNLQILVDGKPSGIASAGNTDALQNIQGSIIERIEVITNPSARYEAEGMAGIINIVLKKDKQKGVNGSFEATIGYPQNYSLGANVNFRRKKINYFLNYNIRYRENLGSGESYQHFMRTDTSYFTTIDRARIRGGLSNQLRGGFDYFLNPTNTLTTSFLVSYNDRRNHADILYHDYPESIENLDEPDELSYLTTREETETDNRKNIEASITYEKKFAKEEHKLTLIAQYENSKDSENSDITQYIKFADPLNRPYLEELTIGDAIESPDLLLKQRTRNKEGERDMLFQADYIYPFGHDGKIEAGFRSAFRNITLPYLVEQEDSLFSNELLDSIAVWDTFGNFSNDFEYIENIHAIYIQAGNNFNKLSLQLGLRAELSEIKTYLKETNKKEETIYPDFFPTLHSTYQFDLINSLQLSYSRRIHRPHHRMLNPFHSFSDSRNIQTGNPNLKPEYTHSLEAGYLMKMPAVNFYSGLYYRNTTNVFERVNIIDSLGITYVTPVNLSRRNSFGIESNITVNIGKWWTLSNDFNFYRSITEGEYLGYRLNSDDYSWNTRFNSKMRFPADINFQTIFNYRAPEETTQGERKAFYMLNMALSKNIFKGKGTLTFNVQDLLNTRSFRFVLDQPELYSINENRWSERSYTLTFIYRLNQKEKPGRESRSNGGDEGEELDF